MRKQNAFCVYDKVPRYSVYKMMISLYTESGKKPIIIHLFGEHHILADIYQDIEF